MEINYLWIGPSHTRSSASPSSRHLQSCRTVYISVALPTQCWLAIHCMVFICYYELWIVDVYIQVQFSRQSERQSKFGYSHFLFTD